MEDVKALRKQLPQFKPNNLRSLVKAADRENNSADADLNIRFIKVQRQQTDRQLDELLLALGIDRSKPDFWERAFFRLAYIHHGTGHLEWTPPKTNKNAATWSAEHDEALVKEMVTLKAQGLTDIQAIKKLASDKKKWVLFPYQFKGRIRRPGEEKRRKDALRSRWTKLTPGGSLSSALQELFSPKESPMAAKRLLESLDKTHLVSLLLAKIKSAKK